MMDVDEICYLLCKIFSLRASVVLPKCTAAVDALVATKNVVFKILYREKFIWARRTRHCRRPSKCYVPLNMGHLECRLRENQSIRHVRYRPKEDEMISKILTYFLSEMEGCEAQRFIYEISSKGVEVSVGP